MPTPVDRAIQSRSAFFAFAGIIGAVAAWSIWGNDSLFPAAPDPRGDPKSWTEEELRRWLRIRNLTSTGKETRAELLARVEASIHAPRH